MSVVEIKPRRGLSGLGISELWEYRELVFFFIWRDVKVRYKQSLLGATWAIMQPLAMMVVFTFVFGRVLDIQTPSGVPKPVFYYAGLVPWTLFSSSLTGASASVMAGAAMISKIYFPRVILPLAATGVYVFDFVIALSVVFVMVLAYGMGITAKIMWLPVFTVLAMLAALAVAIWTSAANVRYRDVAYAVPFLVQLLLFITPLMYPSTQISESILPFYFLNPMAGVIEGFRWAIADAAPAPGISTLVSAAVTLIVLLGGLYYFRGAERTFADVI